MRALQDEISTPRESTASSQQDRGSASEELLMARDMEALPHGEPSAIAQVSPTPSQTSAYDEPASKSEPTTLIKHPLSDSVCMSIANPLLQDSQAASIAPSDGRCISDGSDDEDDEVIRAELPNTWILTLGMRFRDGTKREKFFVTYLRKPNDWLRVSVSVDYRNAEEGSLEQDLQSLGYQRDKNFYIYKAVRESLDEISWFTTVTNLKLETKDERLHIHVAEDVNERIPYPQLKLLEHIRLKFHGYLVVEEKQVIFESHLSGFVYKVRVDDQIHVKKEITSTETVQEFVYEIEALAALRDSRSVVNLVGVVIREIDCVQYVTGVLVEWASRGALNDFFYAHSDIELSWGTRLSWIRQVIQGVSDIHEAGYIQGDCTLSNIVLDSDGMAKIVDINRKGCPIGWEPPEFRGMIQSGQRISMYIGVKSDLYQMGMVLWAIAIQVEEPDRADRPFPLDDPTMPSEVVDIIKSCLAEAPTLRLSAKELLAMLPRAGETIAGLPPLRLSEAPIPKLEDLTSPLPSLEQIQDANNMLYLPHYVTSLGESSRMEPEE